MAKKRMLVLIKSIYRDCPKLLIVMEICIELNIAHKYEFWLGD